MPEVDKSQGAVPMKVGRSLLDERLLARDLVIANLPVLLSTERVMGLESQNLEDDYGNLSSNEVLSA